MAKKVLLVEDDSFIASSILAALEQGGFDTVLAPNGEQALASLAERIPDIVLLDLILPQMSGFDILKHIKEDPKTRQVPVVIFSNLGSPEDIEKGMSLGAKTYLVKAMLTPTEVVEKVKSMIGA